VREINKKVLGVAVALLAVAMLATPMVGMVQAGKGQDKLDFLLHMEGTTNPPPDKVWEAGVTMHVRGGNWIVLGDFYVQIGSETIPKECLSYVGKLDINVNNKKGFYVLTASEVVTIYEDDTKSVERGTLELMALSDNPAFNGANFVGFGTGEFKGVKISGTTTGSMMINPNPPPDNLLVLDRMGIAMGWPT
jgi:hypothetical protein